MHFHTSFMKWALGVSNNVYLKKIDKIAKNSDFKGSTISHKRMQIEPTFPFPKPERGCSDFVQAFDGQSDLFPKWQSHDELQPETQVSQSKT